MLNLLKSLNRRQKSTIFLLMDLILVTAALILTVFAQPEGTLVLTSADILIIGIPYVTMIGASLLILLNIPNMQLAEFDAMALGRVAAMSLGLASSTMGLTWLFGYPLPLPFNLMFGTLTFILMVIARVVSLQIILAIYRRGEEVCRVLIYGAGTTGTQLVQAFRTHRDIDPVAFVDDNSALQGLTISGLPVLRPVDIADIVKRKNIDRVLLAVPSLSPPKQAQIARRLQKMGLEVQTLPSFSQLIGQEALIDKLRTVDPQMLLNRAEDATPLGPGSEYYAGKTVLVSGAGGSIGSELCRQLIECRPRKLILFELSEYALFSVERELRTLANDTKVEIVMVLGSVTDPRQVRHVLASHDVQVILHAAAYKHVNLVQQNPLAGLANNVLGTQTLAQAAVNSGVERFILISSDKAVRPKGVMGASKRLAEMVVQDMASRVPEKGYPVFSMVRFGNVLGSSGSVVPIFNDQIQRGGPVTVTHPHVRRYFMTIQEAARLVLRAGALSDGGEVFLLDMGNPVRIYDLAVQTIEACGYSVRSEENPDGDIEVKFIGLKEGEKLEEELFLDGSERPTTHPKIFMAREQCLSEIEIASALRALKAALAAGDEKTALSVVGRCVPSFRRRRADMTVPPFEQIEIV